MFRFVIWCQEQINAWIIFDTPSTDNFKRLWSYYTDSIFCHLLLTFYISFIVEQFIGQFSCFNNVIFFQQCGSFSLFTAVQYQDLLSQTFLVTFFPHVSFLHPYIHTYPSVLPIWNYLLHKSDLESGHFRDYLYFFSSWN